MGLKFYNERPVGESILRTVSRRWAMRKVGLDPRTDEERAAELEKLHQARHFNTDDERYWLGDHDEF